MMLIMTTKPKTLLFLFLSIAAFLFARAFIIPELIWLHMYNDGLNDTYDYFYDLPLAWLSLFLIMPLVTAIIANLIPILLIRFNVISKEYLSSFVRNYFIGVLLFVALVIWRIADGSYQYIFGDWNRIYGLVDNSISVIFTFLLFLKFRKKKRDYE